MSLKLNERYPGRFNNPSANYPQGSFKNRTSPTAKDGSYLEKDWANDKEGFFQSLLDATGTIPDGLVDEVGSSQYFNALKSLIGTAVTSLSATTVLTKNQLGLIIVSANAGNVNIGLPLSNAALGSRDVIVRRSDISANALVIAASGTDKIMLDTSAVTTGQATTELIFGGDWLWLRSDAAGKWWCVGQAILPASISAGQAIFDTAGVFSFTVPAVLRSGRKRAKGRAIGGGGGGGGAGSTAAGQLAVGGGGDSGGQAEELLDLTGVSSITVTVGLGGPGGVGGVSAGSTGSASSLGTLLSATGGAGGGNLAAGTSITFATAGGNPGVGSNGDINSRGAPGVPGQRFTGNDGFSGAGGPSALSGGGPSRATQGSGLAGSQGSGGGGSLSINGGAATNGGPGGTGFVDVSWS